jgi:hypothetical protein
MKSGGEGMSESKAERAGMTFLQPDNDSLLVVLSGVWKIGNELPSAEEVRKGIDQSRSGGLLSMPATWRTGTALY